MFKHKYAKDHQVYFLILKNQLEFLVKFLYLTDKVNNNLLILQLKMTWVCE